MINVTDSAIVNKIKGTGRTFTLSIVVGSNTYTMVKSLKRSSIFASSQKLSVGETVSAFIEAEIQSCRQSLQNYEVQPKLTIDGYTFNLGYFTVQAPSQADGSGTQKITAYDRMAETSKYTYKATGLTSAKSTFSAICSICGYTAVTSGLTDITINDRLLDGMDCRKALGYVAGVFGKNCVVGTDGKFKMVGYSTVSESVCKISIDSLDTLEFPSQISTIDYFNAVVNDETTYKSGTGNNGVNVVNPLFTSTTQTSNILNNLKSSVGGNGYYPAKFKQLNGDPRIEVGDVIKVEHRDILTGEVTADYVPVMSLTLDYDGGVTVSIEAYPTEAEFSMSLSDKVDFTNSSNNAKFESINSKVDGFEEDIDGANTKADFAVIQSQAVEELNKVIGNSLGLYQTKIEGVGGDTKYYFHNKSTLAKSTYIISMTDQGFAFANSWNNGNPVWTYGINPAGNSIMNYLVVNKISADLIEAGVIKSLDGAPVKTEFSLNTGLFSLEAQEKKETFGFGVNRSNDLMLQYNYSDSEKQGIKLGYYYGGNFYKDSKHTELIPPSTKYYYGDIPNDTFYEYSSNSYQKITNLEEVASSYKGFVQHARGYTYGYEVDEDGKVTSDFNFQTGGLLGIYETIYNENRTPIFKFYSLDEESTDNSAHYTAIRKQSVVTKYLSAEKIAFMQGGDLWDLGRVFTDIGSLVSSMSSEIDVLKQEILNIKQELNVKSVLVYVTADPTTAGFVGGSGSYSLSDEEFVVTATAKSNSEYYISSVVFNYSNGTTKKYNQQTLINNGWLLFSNTMLEMPVKIEQSMLEETINVVVNFDLPEKFRVTLNVDPVGSGTVSGAGLYVPNSSAKITATPNTGYKFVGWYENGTLKYTGDATIIVDSDHTLTAKFEEEEPETPEGATLTVNVSPVGAGTVNPSGDINCEYGDEVSVTATANPGYKFSHWLVNGADSGMPAGYSTIMVPMYEYNQTVTAVFVADSGGGSSPTNKLVVKTEANDYSMGYVSSGGEYNLGDSYTLSATAYSGYIIKALEISDSDGDFTSLSRDDLVDNGLLNSTNTQLTFIVPIDEVGLTVTCKVYFESISSGGGSGENVTYIGEGQTQIADNAYIDKTNIINVVIVEGVTSIGMSAFARCYNLETVTIPNSVTTIKARAFKDCTNLSRVNIGSGVTMILASAFDGCTAITDVYYSGTQSQWNSILKADGNTALTNANIHYNS